MKDPIQGTLDAAREVEIRIGQVRILWSEAVAAKEAAEAGAEALRAELQQSCLLSARVQAEAFECRKEMERLRADYENGVRRDVEVSRQLEQFRTRRRELEATHAAIWGLGCVVTNLLQSGCVEAKAESYERELKRLRRSNEQVREVLGANHGESPVEAAKRLRAEKDNAKAIMSQEIERLRNERDAALARVAELERAIDLEWSPYVHRAAESKS